MGGRGIGRAWIALAAVVAFMTIGIWVGESNEEPAAAGPAVEATEEEAEPAAGDTPEPNSGRSGGTRGEVVEIVATDHAFEVASEIRGGLVNLTLVNNGKELHFAAFAQPKEGVSTEAVRTALGSAGSAPSAGPPPFVEYAGLGTVGPGGESRITMNLPAGEYVVFCAVPSPDGVPHLSKGMMTDVVVTSGTTRGLPDTDATLTAADFAIGGHPDFAAGTNRVTLENRGDQLHELDLVELSEGTTIDDVVAWAKAPDGPPPVRFLGGPAIRDGLSAATTFDLEPGVDYAFVCTIPDSLGDFAPHIVKGMYTPAFRVDP